MNEQIKALQAALSGSPDNIPLRQHLAETLLQQGYPEAAVEEFTDALERDPTNSQLKLGLIRAFYQQEKDSQALVLAEDLLKQGTSSPTLLTLHARLLLRTGNVSKAVQQFRLAMEQDPDLRESDLAERLGIDAAQASEVVDGKLRAGWSNESVSTGPGAVERPETTFQDVGGMDDLKEEIRLKIIYPLTHPGMYRAYGKAIGGGILMYGPPGCGKTHLARATAGEIQAGFLTVGINDILDMWIGNSEKNLHELFEQGRRNRPCVLFFDEVDALAASRADMRYSSSRHLINQFLAELDGINSDNDGLLILAATNAPWHLDTAFRRPGRFDRILFVPPPDAPARATILRLLCRGKPLDEIDYTFLSKKSDRFSGADLKAAVDVAVEKKLQQAMRTGTPSPLTTKDLATAIASIKPSAREWFGTARNYAIHANQDGTYDDILKYLDV